MTVTPMPTATKCRLEVVGREAGVYWSASDLMGQTFPEPRWAVPGLIPEGLTLLVGSPKFGKSWMCLGLAVAVASGGRALGRVKVDQGAVLYAALEDPARRLQNRLAIVLGDEDVPRDLSLTTSLPRLPDAVEYLDGWVEAHSNARLIIIDVLRKIRPPSNGRSSMYDDDYDTLSGLKAMADRRGVAVVVVHHSRKAADEGDVFGEVSGSTGLTGAADGVLYAKRARNTSEAVLHLTGRDVVEQEHAMRWDAASSQWVLSDEPVVLATMGSTRRRILEHIAANEGDTPAKVSLALSLPEPTVRQNVRRMVSANQLETDGQGRYFLPVSLSHLSPLSLSPAVSDTSDSSDTPLSDTNSRALSL